MINRNIIKVILYTIAILSCLPVVILFVGSVTSGQESKIYLQGVLADTGKTSLVLLPSFPTLRGYVELLLDTPEFYVVFWNSVKITVIIIAGQMLTAVPAAWGIARGKSKIYNVLFYFYVLLMLLPFQVTMLSNYIVLDNLNMLNRHSGIIIPAVFSTFSVFIIYRFFLAIPEELFEAFSLESSSRIQMFLRIGIPLVMPGIKAAALLGAIEYWNMIEQPLVFLGDSSLWPFSLYLPNLNESNVQYVLTFSFVVLVPMLLISIFGKEHLENGIGSIIVNR